MAHGRGDPNAVVTYDQVLRSMNGQVKIDLEQLRPQFIESNTRPTVAQHMQVRAAIEQIFGVGE
jgi:hypothetical protein